MRDKNISFLHSLRSPLSNIQLNVQSDALLFCVVEIQYWAEEGEYANLWETFVRRVEVEEAA